MEYTVACNLGEAHIVLKDDGFDIKLVDWKCPYLLGNRNELIEYTTSDKWKEHIKEDTLMQTFETTVSNVCSFTTTYKDDMGCGPHPSAFVVISFVDGTHFLYEWTYTNNPLTKLGKLQQS